MPQGTASVHLDGKTPERLGAIAKATGRSHGALMSHAIERDAESEAWQVAAIQEAIGALARGEADLVDHAQVAKELDTGAPMTRRPRLREDQVAPARQAGLAAGSHLHRQR
jgi:predicted transcriptional regulator